jgi:hypothetical protein
MEEKSYSELVILENPEKYTFAKAEFTGLYDDILYDILDEIEFFGGFPVAREVCGSITRLYFSANEEDLKEICPRLEKLGAFRCDRVERERLGSIGCKVYPPFP